MARRDFIHPQEIRKTHMRNGETAAEGVLVAVCLGQKIHVTGEGTVECARVGGQILRHDFIAANVTFGRGVGADRLPFCRQIRRQEMGKTGGRQRKRTGAGQ